ncbi:hypothetical protein BjapCC829_45710 (plasmid) [Bradyrhizobium barranii]|uniref:Uncharacterized protein n=1 Tax=Bradyrhizobium barranii TaxID=2992140 RepID=A0ABY3R1L2_9BRAD|nr:MULTISPECIES: hypothetical protein [Bradyrhizobium]UFW91748.1 hypothetical protein BjapCC829_45710 [Bradyrhizobium japonicum]WFU00272.1 hypothetical protein QA633_46460 [Bradyrhizobium barranii]
MPPFYGMGSIAFALSRRDGGFACVVVNVRLRLSQALPKAQISRLRRSLVTTFEVSFGQPGWSFGGHIMLGGSRALFKPAGIDDDRLRSLCV